MKALSLSLVLAAACCFVGVSAARAGIVLPMKFHAPFSFYVGGTELPAGTYIIEPRVNAPGSIEVSGPSVGVPLAVESVVPTGAPASTTKHATGQVTFTRIENVYVLGEVWDNVNRLGVEGTTAAEHHAAERAHSRAPQSVTVPATAVR